MSAVAIPTRTARRLGCAVSALGWGAFKIGRNEGIKYPEGYALPSGAEAIALVHGVIALGVTLIDTAPAYGLSEERVGRALATLAPAVRDGIVLSTKAGETFIDGISRYDFSRRAIERSLALSHERLQSKRIDLVSIHSDGADLAILRDGSALAALNDAKSRGTIGAIGFSPKSVEGACLALAQPEVDAIMVEFHPEAPEFVGTIAEAHTLGIAVLVKKPLASGRLDPATAIPWILNHPGVTSVVVGGLSLERLRANALIAATA